MKPTKTSQTGIDLIKSREGLELKAYKDIAGIWTIGYGHTGDDVTEGMEITEAEAEALLARDLKSRETVINNVVRADLNQNQFDALVSLIYNIGAGGFKRSTVLRRLNRLNYQGAADAFLMWNKATINGVLTEVDGLTERRKAERELFLREG